MHEIVVVLSNSFVVVLHQTCEAIMRKQELSLALYWLIEATMLMAVLASRPALTGKDCFVK